MDTTNTLAPSQPVQTQPTQPAQQAVPPAAPAPVNSDPSLSNPSQPGVTHQVPGSEQQSQTQAPTPESTTAPPPPTNEMTLTPPPVYKHEPTGNAAYDVAMTAFAEKGFSPDHPAFLPATKGDFAALEQFCKEKGISPQYLELAKQAHQQISAHHEATHGATIKQALELAGGAERWNAVKEWVQKTADPDELREWATELEAGGKRTLAAAKYLSDLYAMHGENQPSERPADPFNPNSSPVVATNGAPLSPQEFRSEMQKIIEKVGYSGLEKSPEYRALQQRRLAWRG